LEKRKEIGRKMNAIKSIQSALEMLRRPLSLFLLASGYTAGALIIRYNLIEGFIRMTPFHLLLSFVILWWNHRPHDRQLALYTVLAFVFGYGAEVLGVATGILFGEYRYGPVLGVKVWEVPLLIGVNWAMQVYIGNETLNRLLPENASTFLRAALGAAVPVAVDVLIEPVAIRYNMWHWEHGDPPLQNYIGWYLVSLVLSFAYQRWLGQHNRNWAAPLLMILQVLFFLFLRP
jgi:bisanhydrobacterioruberin hydratase